MENEWHDLAKEKPEGWTDCWVRRANGNIELANYHEGLDGGFRDIYNVNDADESMFDYYEDVTHWMELEEPVFQKQKESDAARAEADRISKGGK